MLWDATAPGGHSGMLQDAAASRMLRDALGYCCTQGMLWDAPGHSGMLWDATAPRGHSGMLQDAAMPGMLWDALERCCIWGMLRDALGCSGTLPYLGLAAREGPRGPRPALPLFPRPWLSAGPWRAPSQGPVPFPVWAVRAERLSLSPGCSAARAGESRTGVTGVNLFRVTAKGRKHYGTVSPRHLLRVVTGTQTPSCE